MADLWVKMFLAVGLLILLGEVPLDGLSIDCGVPLGDGALATVSGSLSGNVPSDGLVVNCGLQSLVLLVCCLSCNFFGESA